MDARPRQLTGWIATLAIGLVLLGAGKVAHGQGEAAKAVPEAKSLPIEQRPYLIRVWLRTAPGARLTPGQGARIIGDWRELAGRFVGAPWVIEPQPEERTATLQPPERLTAEEVGPLVEGADKGWFLEIDGGGEGGGLLLTGREYDAATRQIGPIYRRRAVHARDVAREMLKLSRQVFAPTAEVERADPAFRLKVQGSALPVADDFGRVAGPGTIFRPFLIGLGANDEVRGIREVPYTYLRVREGASASPFDVDVVSGLRRPLPRQVAGRSKILALGSKAASVPTRFRFVSPRASDKELIPVPGAVLTARTYPNGPPRVVGTTGRDGEITLPAGFSDDLVMVRVLAGGTEPLREIPVLPGETTEVRELPVEARPEAVALEYRLKALQDEILDTIARRGILERRMADRTQGQVWEEVKKLLDDYRKLPTKDAYERRLTAMRDDAQKRQTEQKIAILTQSAQAQLAEVDSMIQNYLGNEAINQYQEAYDLGTQPPPESAKPGVPGRPPAPSPPPAVPQPSGNAGGPSPSAGSGKSAPAKESGKPAQRPAPAGGVNPF